MTRHPYMRFPTQVNCTFLTRTFLKVVPVRVCDRGGGRRGGVSEEGDPLLRLIYSRSYPNVCLETHQAQIVSTPGASKHTGTRQTPLLSSAGPAN